MTELTHLALTWVGVLVSVAAALLGNFFGFHPAVGAYLAGLIISEEYFLTGRDEGSYHGTKRIVDNVAFSWIGPVLFVHLGAQLQLNLELLLSILPQVVALTLGVMIFQVLSASLAARYTGGMKKAASLMIGFGMLGRAELAFVVMDIAYVEHPILSEEAFATLMVTCFFLNIAVPLSIHWWKPALDREQAQARARPELRPS